MVRRYRFSQQEKAELWRRWQAGETLKAIAGVLGCHGKTVSTLVARRGGIAPPERQRSSRHLSLEEREAISRALAAGRSLRWIAAQLCRAPSTICREVARHGGVAAYRATVADQCAWDQARRPKRCRLAQQPRLCRAVASKLLADWSPQQIAGWLEQTYPADQTMRVSHETIYRSLFVQARGVLRQELSQHLRSQQRVRQPRSGLRAPDGRGQIKDAISISERPAVVEDRAVPGHWEGDLLAGGKNSYIATLVERHSRYAMLVKVPGKDTVSVVRALSRKISRLPQELKGSLTWDRGMEMANHKDFTLATDLQVYFCDPRSPWQRGSNENTNGLLRQYFPKGMDLSDVPQSKLNWVARRLNGRPRQTLGFKTPAEVLSRAVASTS